jgi:SMC interacting uncharacterized protein involved in chromosome segregation
MKNNLWDVAIDLGLVKWVVGGFYSLVLLLIGAIVKNTIGRIDALEKKPVALEKDVDEILNKIEELENAKVAGEKELLQINAKIDLLIQNQNSAQQANVKMFATLEQIRDQLLRKNLL